MVRSEARVETKQYYRGGMSFPLSNAIREACGLHAHGRAVIFVEPTNRLNNLLSVNLVMDRSSGLTMEVLGPGYDVGDLNRGGLIPEVSIQVPNMDWEHFEEPRAWDFKIRRYGEPAHCEQRRALRLTRLATDILPRLGHIKTRSIRDAEAWLKKNGYVGIWRNTPITLGLPILREFYDDAFMIVGHLWHKPWQVLGCSASDLGDGRLIYWDIVYPNKKFGAEPLHKGGMPPYCGP